MTQNPATMTVQEAIEFAATNAGWTKQTRDVRRSIHNVDKEGDALEEAWMEEHGFHCIESTGGICTYWTHPTERSVMGSKPPWFQPNLDSAAASMPSGLHIQLTQHSDGWYAVVRWPHKFSGISIEQADTELLARWRLVVACMLAEKGASHEH